MLQSPPTLLTPYSERKPRHKIFLLVVLSEREKVVGGSEMRMLPMFYGVERYAPTGYWVEWDRDTTNATVAGIAMFSFWAPPKRMIRISPNHPTLRMPRICWSNDSNKKVLHSLPVVNTAKARNIWESDSRTLIEPARASLKGDPMLNGRKKIQKEVEAVNDLSTNGKSIEMSAHASFRIWFKIY